VRCPLKKAGATTGVIVLLLGIYLFMAIFSVL
jgi:hypothetical protein